jgi:hypothetical protein
MSTEREGSHRLLRRKSEFNLDIGRVAYGRHRRGSDDPRFPCPAVMKQAAE